MIFDDVWWYSRCSCLKVLDLLADGGNMAAGNPVERIFATSFRWDLCVNMCHWKFRIYSKRCEHRFSKREVGVHVIWGILLGWWGSQSAGVMKSWMMTLDPGDDALLSWTMIKITIWFICFYIFAIFSCIILWLLFLTFLTFLILILHYKKYIPYVTVSKKQKCLIDSYSIL